MTLTVTDVEVRKVPPRNKKLGNVLVFDDKITKINGSFPSEVDIQVFAFASGNENGGCARPANILPVSQERLSRTVVNFRPGAFSISVAPRA